MRTVAVSLVSMALAWLSFSNAAEPPKFRKLVAVPFTDVKVQDSFWAPRLQTNREASLPHNFQWCEETGRISNFAKAAGLAPGKFEGKFFNDSDVYKVLEGASYSLADHPDPALEKTIDDVIAKIAAAQQPDGYLNSYFTLAEPGKRWTDFRNKHELYCAGHFFEAAVAHYRATGKRTLLDVAIRFADHLDRTFGPGKRCEVCGHEEVELALVKLYQLTGEKRYLDLARFFIDARGDSTKRETWGPYYQDHVPVRRQDEIVGHAVRAMYLYCGVADVASYTGDRQLMAAMDRIWNDVVGSKMYITGGIGARHKGEAFGDRYELPNDTAYCETCAAIGLALWSHRLNLMHGDARYVDVLERALYNGVLSGMGLDGKLFFYVNPLASSGTHHRQPFYATACCPTNLARLIPSVPGYVYAVGDGGIYVNLYMAGVGRVPADGSTVELIQMTDYPWDGHVKLAVGPQKPAPFAINLRIPDWCRGATLAVNGKAIESLDIHQGYARIERAWQPGDVIDLELPMPVERMEADPRVTADAGRVALQRGPVVYCFEAVDNGGRVQDIVLAKDAAFVTEHRPELLGGVTVVKTQAKDGRPLTAIPYYAWDHRQAGEMAVWIPLDGRAAAPGEGREWGGRLYRRVE